MAFHTFSARRIRCALVLAVLCAGRISSAQMPEFSGFGGLRGPSRDPATVKAEFQPASGEQPALLYVTVDIEMGYHVSAVDQAAAADGGGPVPTTIKVTTAGVRVVEPFRPIEAPETHIDKKAWVGLELREHYDSVTWVAPVEFDAGIDSAGLSIDGVVEGQACDAKSCVPVELSFTARAGRGVPLPNDFWSGEAAAAAAAPLAAIDTDAAVNASSSLWLVAAYGVLGGLILNLMPCVLPVLGLKLLTFAKQGGESRRHVLGLNVAYSAGILAVFMVLATLATLVQLGLSSESFNWGELNTLTWYKVAMTALVFSMALAFLGVWEIPIPGFAASGKATELSSQEGPGGAFCMGVFTTLLATPCSGPFLGPVFGYTITQPPAVTFLVFGAVGVGMALPYLIVGAFPALVNWLPKPGAWMDTLKNVLGFVLLATVVFLFSSLSAEWFIPTLALLFSIWFGCWIIGRAPAWAESAHKRRVWAQGLLAAALLGGASFVLLAPGKQVLPWQPYSPEALAAARAEGKTVLVDFTANWCLTCKVNLKLAINREEVRKLIARNGVVPLLADWSDRNDMIKQALAELNSRSIPVMAIYPSDPDAEVLVLPDLLTQGQVIAALEKAGPSLGATGLGPQSRTMTATRTAGMAGSER